MRRTFTVSVIAAAALAVTVFPAIASATAHRHLPTPPRTPHLGAAIESFAAYQPEFFCRNSVEPGVKAFEHLVLTTYPKTTSLGDMRACSVGGTSEHYDGRAFDWGADHRVPAQRAAGKSLLRWLFATDSHGNADAMFRRLGLMYVIWNKRIWGAWDRQWEPYSCSGVTDCHVNHIHFSFGWAGAEKLTSYWTGDVTGTAEPPLPKLSALHAHRMLQVLARSASTVAHWLVAPNRTYRVTARGVWRSSDGARADAQCVKTEHGWRRSAGGGLSIGGDQLHLWTQRWTPTRDNGSGCNAKSHTYRLLLHPTALSTVTAQLSGAGSREDAGRLRLRFVRTA